MARFNRFGAVAADVLALYPGTVAADFDAGGASGTTRIESALDRIAREVAGALSPEVYRQMTQVDCELVVRRATSGQTTFDLGLGPMIAGTLHLWQYPAEAYMNLGDQGFASSFWRKPAIGFNQIPAASIATSTAGAVTSVTLSGVSLSLNDRVFASYDVDVASASFAMRSVADLVALGAAAELGALLYTDGSQEWKLVDEYRGRYRGTYVVTEGGTIGQARLGNWVPDELRALSYWKDVERASNEVGSVRRYRA